jgi:hypothetical protein
MSMADAFPNITELRIEALHSDGSRRILTFIPEHQDTLRVNVVPEPAPEAEAFDLAVAERGTHPVGWRGEAITRYRVDVTQVALMHVEDLIRRPSTRQ